MHSGDAQYGKTDEPSSKIELIKKDLNDKNAPFGVDLLIPQVGGNARKTNVRFIKSPPFYLESHTLIRCSRLTTPRVNYPN